MVQIRVMNVASSFVLLLLLVQQVHVDQQMVLRLLGIQVEYNCVHQKIL